MSTVNGSPIRLVIPGKYWDAQIYAGELILFGQDGSLNRINWRKLISSISMPEDLRLFAEAAFIGSRDYYSDVARRLIQDQEIQPIVENKFRRLEELVSSWSLNVAPVMRTSDNPLPFPHNDSDVHYGRLFVAARSGIFSMSSGGKGSKSSSDKLSDVPAVDIATKHGTIAIAAGDEGLFQLALRRSAGLGRGEVAGNVCSSCEWSYASIVASNHGRSLFVAAFARVREEPENKRNKRLVRQFDRVVTDSELFPRDDGQSSAERAIEWGAKDRIYKLTGHTIEVIRNVSNGRTEFEKAGRHFIDASFDLDAFVDVRVAPFGSVLEFDDGIKVLLNSGAVVDFPGEPVNWRVYPRSLNYLNHLHIVYDDRIEIIAFTSDYFTAPSMRLFGTEPISSDEGGAAQPGIAAAERLGRLRSVDVRR